MSRTAAGKHLASAPGERRRTTRHLVLIVAAALLLLPALLVPPRMFGDSGEYYLTAESLLNHGTPDLRGSDVSRMAGRMIHSPVQGSGRTLSAYRTARSGALYAQHFWLYSALTVPARVVLPRLGLNEFKAFQVSNALLLVGAVWVCLAAAPFALPWRLVYVALVLSSPLAWFLVLPHPEACSAALVMVALCLWASGSAAGAALAAAFASVQNPPLLLLAGSCGVVALAASRPAGRLRRLLLVGAAGVVAITPYVFDLLVFGTPSLIADENIHLELIRPGRALELLYDPNIGFVRCSAATIGLAAALSAWALAQPAVRSFVLAIWALILAMAHVCSGMADWNHGTSGPSRYTVWLYPLVAWLVCVVGSRVRSRVAVVLAGAAVASQLAVFVVRHGFAAPDDHLRHSSLSAFLLTHSPRLYSPTPEIFAERTAQQDWHPEVDRDRPVVFAQGGRCRKALAQKRHVEALRALCGPEPREFADFVAALRARGAGRSQWIYIDY